MKNVFKDVGFLDKRAVDSFCLTNEILMENAASAMENVIDSNVSAKNALIMIVCGNGNNGADGFALARRLSGKYNVKVFVPPFLQNRSKSELNITQQKRFEAIGGKFSDGIFLCDILVDCLFGSGFSGEMQEEAKDLITQMNAIGRVKIACDMPSGIFSNNVESTFKADITISMGALKTTYFSDFAKDFIGEIIEANLGIAKEKYEQDSHIKLLETSDLNLPNRTKQNTHKGHFGHSCVIAGEKEGACILSALASFAFGSGLVSVIGDVKHLPHHIMNTTQLPKNCNAIAFGMGLGKKVERYDFDFLGKIPTVIDADMFYHNDLKNILEKGNLVLTPHLKEFSAMIKMLGFGNFSIQEIESKKIDLMLDFSCRFPNTVLVLKSANVFIAHKENIYINIFGRNNLAKGGSGDVLSGLILSLLVQNYSLLDAAISASLAHALASQKVESSFALTPKDLINAIKLL